MKKRVSSLLMALPLVAGLFSMPQLTYAGDCTQPVEDVTDYTVEVTTDINFRSSIQGGEDDECAESEVIGSFGVGQVVWVLGEIETGVPVEEDSDEFVSWLYVQHPVTKDYGFLWGKYAKKIPIPADELDHEEFVIEEGGLTGTGEPADESAEQDSEPDEDCEVIEEVADYFVKSTDSLNVRDGVCNGEAFDLLASEQVVKVIGELGVWRYIQLEGGTRGFVHSEYVEVVDTPVENLEDAEELVGDDKAVVREDPEASEVNNPDGLTLPDVIGHEYETAIRYLEDAGIVEGYPDGFYKAKLPVNRAEFTKIVVGAELGSEPFSSASDCFDDVAEEAWYSSYVCYAKEAGIIDGYPDGLFRPGDSVNLVEASKILVNTFEIQKANVGEEWYAAYIGGMENRNYIPTSFTALDQEVDRGQMAEMMWRILEDVTNKSNRRFGFGSGSELIEPVETTDPDPENGYVNACYDSHLPIAIDFQKVRNAWLEWHNDKRSEYDVDPLVLHEVLNYSSNTWSKYNQSIGQMTHQRTDGMTTSEWFADLGIGFQLLQGYVFAENVAVGDYSCDETDCTDEMIAALDQIYDAFIAQEGAESASHFNNIIESDFKQLGLGLAIDESANQVYATVHFAQAIESYPDTCQ